MNRFRNGNLQMLIATDVAARGIDVNDVDGVINYDVPQDIEYYVAPHRTYRQSGKRGWRFTLASRRNLSESVRSSGFARRSWKKSIFRPEKSASA